MADRDLQVVLNSGDITGWNKGGTASTNAVLNKGENDAIYQDLAGENAIVKTKFTPQGTPPAHIEGQQYYDTTRQSMIIQGPYDDVEVRIGHGMHTHIINESGAIIEKGMACRHDGVTVGGKVRVVKAIANSFVNARLFGVAAADIGIGEEGAITTFGEIEVLDTSSVTAGVPVYLSDTVAGTWIETAPDIVTQVGGVTVSDATDGVLFVSIINNDNIPTVFGGLQGQTLGNESYSLTTTAQDIINYETEESVVVGLDALTGQIALPNDGEYRMHFAAAMTFTSSTSTRSVTLEFYDVTNTLIHFSYVKNIPRDATQDSLSFSWPIAESADNVHKMRIKASTAMTITFDEISFDMQSVNIR